MDLKEIAAFLTAVADGAKVEQVGINWKWFPWEYEDEKRLVMALLERPDCIRLAPAPAEPKWVELGPEDVPPGSVFRMQDWPGYCHWNPCVVCDAGIIFFNLREPELVSWPRFMQNQSWQIKRPGEDWTACRKEAL